MIMLQQALNTIQRGWGEWVPQVQQGIPGPRKNKYTSTLKCLKPGSVNWNVHKPDRCFTRRHWDTLGDASLVHEDRDHGAGSFNWTLEGLRPLMGEDEGTRHSHQWKLNDKHLLKNTNAKGKGAGRPCGPHTLHFPPPAAAATLKLQWAFRACWYKMPTYWETHVKDQWKPHNILTPSLCLPASMCGRETAPHWGPKFRPQLRWLYLATFPLYLSYSVN